MKPPVISVILPVYNGEGIIRTAKVSILQQIARSTDLHHDRPHRRLAAALNYGIRQASGKYIACMDADDYSCPYHFALQLNTFSCKTCYAIGTYSTL